VQGTGQAIAPILAGALIASGRYDLAFVVAGAIGVFAPVLVAGLPLSHAASPHAGKSIRFAEGIVAVLRERRILVASLTHAAYYVMNGTLTAFLPLFAQDRIGLSPIEIGWLFGMQTVTTLAIRPLVGAASDRLGRRGAIVAGLVTCATGVLTIAAARTSIEIQAAVVLYAAGVAMTTAATSAYITDVAPRARFGAAHGVFGTIYDIGDAAGPLIGGVLVAAVGYEPTFRAMAALALVAAALFSWQSRGRHRRA
jgi:MFS family permease